MTGKISMLEKLNYFLLQFKQLNSTTIKTDDYFSKLERIICEFSSFILCKENVEKWRSIIYDEIIDKLVLELRDQSAFAVWAIEKYRASELLKNNKNVDDYFNNIEMCIENEFESCRINSNSKVMLIGSGAFPMTLLLITKKTKADVIGLDIDSEAVHLAKKILAVLDNSGCIKVTSLPVEQLEFTKTATHIIFASTVKEKFAILNQLHSITNNDVIVAMRYGNDFKSLFNYPLEKIDKSLWTLEKNIIQPNSIFDIAIYLKKENCKYSNLQIQGEKLYGNYE
jgi:hypothetical protein